MGRFDVGQSTYLTYIVITYIPYLQYLYKMDYQWNLTNVIDVI